jgi:hypothetical protein
MLNILSSPVVVAVVLLQVMTFLAVVVAVVDSLQELLQH